MTEASVPEVDIEVIQSVFHLPIEQAAKRLGMCVTVLKRICRSHGIARWPYRKLKSLDKMIESIEKFSEVQPDKVQEHLSKLKRMRQAILFPQMPQDEEEKEEEPSVPLSRGASNVSRYSPSPAPTLPPSDRSVHANGHAPSVLPTASCPLPLMWCNQTAPETTTYVGESLSASPSRSESISPTQGRSSDAESSPLFPSFSESWSPKLSEGDNGLSFPRTFENPPPLLSSFQVKTAVPSSVGLSPACYPPHISAGEPATPCNALPPVRTLLLQLERSERHWSYSSRSSGRWGEGASLPSLP